LGDDRDPSSFPCPLNPAIESGGVPLAGRLEGLLAAVDGGSGGLTQTRKRNKRIILTAQGYLSILYSF